MKNIVICSDGTNAQLDGDLTNVVRLYEVAVKDPGQVVFYDPGVGTIADPLARGSVSRYWSVVAGLAFGAGLRENVFDAYRFLMRVYEPGDRVFLFGFSRGAFTVRVLAGLLDAVGLLGPNTENLLPNIWRSYRNIRDLPNDATDAERTTAEKNAAETEVVRRCFTRPCPVAFLGPWDTVGSVGMYNWNQAFAGTYENISVAIVRHAVSLDERRAAFRSNVFKADIGPLPNGRPRVMNVWFPGVHSDIGGGYPWPGGSGLAMVAFTWMLREATEAGLRVDAAKLQALMTACPPDPCGEIHESLKGGWKVLEKFPARRYNWDLKKTIWRRQPNKPRKMLGPLWIHQSVRTRMEQDKCYRPPNLSENDAHPTEG